jgi:hypothetical protein
MNEKGQPASNKETAQTANTLSPKVKRKHEQTSRKDDAAGSLGRKETDMRFSFTNWTLASI